MPIELSTEDIVTIKKLEELCRIDPKLVISKGRILLDKYNNKSDQLELAGLYKSVGFSYCFISKFEDAIKNSSIALDGFLNQNDHKGISECYFNIGTIYFYAGNYSLSLVNYKKALDISTSIGFELLMANSYNGIGSVYYAVNQDEDSIRYLLKAFEIATKVGDNGLLGRIADGLAEAYLNLLDFENATYYGEYSLTQYDGNTMQFYVARANKVLGKIHLERGNHGEAQDYYKRALTLFEKQGSAKEILAIKVEIARVSIANNQLNAANKLLAECEKNLIGTDFFELEKSVIELQIRITKINKKEQLLWPYYEKLATVQTKIIRTNSTNNGELIGLSEHVSSYENLELKKKAEQLERSNESLKTLTQIGEEIASISDIEELIEKIYEKLNTLLDASMLAISIYDKDKDELDIPLTIEKGKKLGQSVISLQDKTRLAVICFNESKEIVINDIDEILGDQKLNPSKAYIGEMPESIVYIPLKVKRKTIGTLSVQSFKKNSYTEKNVEILRNLSIYIGIAIENAYLMNNLEEKVSQRTKEVNDQKEKLEKSNKNIGHLNEIGKTIAASLSVEDIIEKALTNINGLMPAEAYGIGIYDHKTQAINKIIVEAGIKQYVTDYLTEDVYSIQCYKAKKPIVINKEKLDEKAEITSRISTKIGVQMNSIIYYPLISNDKCFGVMTVQSTVYSAYSESHIEILEVLASYTAIALGNARIYEEVELEVAKRTKEINSAYLETNLLSKIGKEIASCLSIDLIIETVYEKVNQLMEATTMVVGFYDKKKEILVFPGTIEKGVKFDTHFVGLHETNKMAVICFNQTREILVNDMRNEAKLYTGHDPVTLAGVGEIVDALIYVPLLYKEETIGVLSVQSFTKGVYTSHHLDILRNIAVYVSIAAENATLFQHVEEEVKERTAEVISQKEEIEKSYQDIQLLSKIGQEISSSLMVEEIILKASDFVRDLMNAEMFGIGLLNDNGTSLNVYSREKNENYDYVLDLASEKLGAKCFNNKQEILINEWSEALNYISAEIYVAPAGDQTESIIYSPIIYNEKCIGVITVQSFQKNVFNLQHIHLLKNLANYTSIALENAKAYQNLQTLSYIGKEITSTLNLDSIFDTLYQNVNKLMDAWSFMICSFDKNTNEFVYELTIENNERILKGYRAKLMSERSSFSSWCYINKKEIYINDVETERRAFTDGQLIPAGEIPNSLIYIPLIVGGEVIGLLSVQSLKKQAYSKQHLEILRSLASFAGVALTNAQVYEKVELEVAQRTLQINEAHLNAERISDIGKQMTSTLDLNQVLDIFHRNISSFMEADCIGVRLVNKSKNVFECIFEITDGERLENFTIEIGKKNDFSNWTLENKREIFIHEYTKDCANYGIVPQTQLYGKKCESVIFLPLELHNEILGVITIQSYKKSAFTEYHLNILKTFAIYTSIAIYNARSFERVEKEIFERTQEVVAQKNELEGINNNIRLLNEIGQEITAVLSYLDVTRIVYNQLKDLMQLDGFGLAIYDEIKNALVFPGVMEKDELIEGVEVSLDSGRLPAWCFKNQKEIVILTVDDRSKYGMMNDLPIIGQDPVSVIYVPVFVQDECIGVMSIQSLIPNAFSPADVNLFRNLASYVAVAITNARSFENLRALSNIGKEVASTFNMVQIADVVYENVHRLLDATTFVLATFDNQSKKIKYVRLYEESLPIEIDVEYHIDERDSLAVYCVKNKVEVLINQFSEVQNYIADTSPIVGRPSESIIYIPLIYQNQVVGLFSVQSFKKNEYQLQHVELLKNIASHLAVALNNAISHKQLKDIGEIGQEITSLNNLKEINQLVYDKLKPLLSLNGFGIAIHNQVTNSLDFHSYIEDGIELDFHSESLTSDRYSAYCFNNKEIIHLGEDKDGQRYFQGEYVVIDGNDVESLVYVPLMQKNDCIGVITVQAFNRNVFSKQDVTLIENLAPYIAVAIDNARSFENLKALSKIGKEVTSTFSVEQIADLLYDSIKNLMDASSFILSTFDNQTRKIKIVRLYEEGELVSGNFEYDIDTKDSLAVYCIMNKIDIRISHHDEILKYTPDAEVVIGKPSESILYIPLIFQNNVVGILSVQSFQENVYTTKHLEVLKNIGSYLSVALNNALSHKQLREIGEIGKEITSLNNVREINQFVYDKLQLVMSLDGFGIGIYNQINESIDFHDYIEGGNELGFIAEKLDDERLSVICFRAREAIKMNSISEIESFVKGEYEIIDGVASESIVYVPLIQKNNCIGVITVQSFSQNAFSDQDVSLIQNLAPFIAVAIENASSFNNLTQLSLIGKEVTSLLDLGKVVDILHERLSLFLDTTVFLIGLYDEKNETVNLVKVYEEGKVIAENLIRDANDKTKISHYCIMNKAEVFTTNKEETEKYSPNNVQKDQEGKEPESVIYLPLIYEEVVIGVLSVQSFYQNSYTKQHLEILRNVASYVTVTINNIKSYKALERAKSEMEKLSIVASETDNGIVISNNKGEIEWVNEAYTEMTGYNLTDLFESNKTTIQSMSTFAGIDLKLAEVLVTKESVNYEGMFVDKNGNKRFVQTTLTPILDKSGEIYKLVAIDSDISLQKLAELEIREKNKDITDSINYAKRIQTAMLPSDGFFKSSLPDSFIYYEPRDIVSGDFYWMTKTDKGEVIVAAADCTGHGVPGAFLTIVGNNLLNQIVIAEGETRPGKILEEMNKRLLERFSGNSETKIRDGMDISVCKLLMSNETIKVTYSGAFNSLYYVVEGQLFELDANRFAIGTPIEDGDITFFESEINLNKNSMIYLFSDGYADQLGGEQGKKYMKKRFKEFLIEISRVPIAEQHKQLKNNLLLWSGDNQQVDDVLVIGIKL